MRITWKLCVIFFSVAYITITVVAIYRLYSESKTIGYNSSGNIHFKRSSGIRKNYSELEKSSHRQETVEIWGKAAIGLFLWKHVLNGELQNLKNGFIQEGYLTVDDITFIYRSGPGIIQTTVPNDVQYLILVLNGRSDEKIAAAKLWLDYVPFYTKLKKLAVVLLGNERCNNNWILPYMRSRGGRIDLVFLVYDSPLVDNVEFHQWPLGVAVYRGFPNIKPQQVDVSSARSHVCNFLGTVYENSSRKILSRIIKSMNFQENCIILERKKWLPLETEESLKYYIDSLLKTDLTLCPVGINTECYRIYEAMSLGSVPIIENVRTDGTCDNVSSLAPLRLLKQYDAPVIYVRSWYELFELLKQEAELTLEEKVDRRTAVVKWYMNFKSAMSKHFLNTIKKKFF
ncbi:ribitol-5-phosphate xylosyltransferase 1-like [Periplaneta americana]|uniref:ribitol-5-phosphate xylosyltransferase 1-like n=1 Tax=Periplaneta americana TaxID=6978 RepID=UPI0037E97A17